MTKGRAATLVRSRQIGWTERNRQSLHYATLHSPTPACAAFSKESRMKSANATKFDRKSGVA